MRAEERKNTKKLEAIISQTKGSALGAIKRYLRAELHHLIDDVAQETFLRIYQMVVKGKFIDEKTLSSLVYTTAKHESFRANKKALREIMKQEFLAEKNSFEPEVQSPLVDELFEVLNQVPETYRHALLLFANGYSIKEIARDLAIAEGTAKSRISRGKEIARRLFFSEGGSL